MECDGRELNRYQYQLLFAVIGYTYGGDNVNKFNLPDLRGQAYSILVKILGFRLFYVQLSLRDGFGHSGRIRNTRSYT